MSVMTRISLTYDQVKTLALTHFLLFVLAILLILESLSNLAISIVKYGCEQ